jgi:hypothetical protein
MISGRLGDDKYKSMFFKNLTFGEHARTTSAGFTELENMLRIKGVFLVDGEEKTVIIQNSRDTKISGIVQNDLEGLDVAVDVIDADKPNNSYAFALDAEYKTEFLDFARSVYGFECYIPDDSHVSIIKSKDDIMGDDEEEVVRADRCTDLVLIKPGGIHVHYKQMSAGEKKIATMLQMLFNKHYKKSGILLIDNIEMHIYFKRHLLLIEKMEEFFPSHQIIATTHSSVLVNELDDGYLVNVEEYLLKS